MRNELQQKIEKNISENSAKCAMANNNNSVNERVTRAEPIDKIENLSPKHSFSVIVHSTGKVITGNLIANKFDIVDVEAAHDEIRKWINIGLAFGNIKKIQSKTKQNKEQRAK